MYENKTGRLIKLKQLELLIKECKSVRPTRLYLSGGFVYSDICL